LYLSLFAFFAMIRLLFATFSIVTLWFPNIPYEISLKLELAPIYCCSFFYYLYMLAYDGISENKPVTYLMKGVCVFCLVTNFCLPLRIANYFTPFYEAYMLLGGFLYGLYLTFTKKKKTLEENFGEPMRRRHKRSFNMFDFIGFIVIFGGCVHDVAVLWGISMPFAYGDWIMYSFILFVIVQSVNTAWRWDTLNTRIKSLAVQTARANNAAYRFVPQQFLRLLGKNDICSVKAKDHCTKKVALLSADLRNFTTISEGMNGAEMFSLLNEYFRAVAPIIRQYGGFIEKVMGDGIVAIFDSPCDGALACAIDMQSAMVGLRESFAARSLPVFEIGIGVHYGQVVLGIVGSDKRMSEVVVSPAVDIADDVEGYNKVCREPVLASEEAVAAIKEKDKFNVELVRPASSMNGEGRQDGTYTGTIYKVQRS
jgi:class 3 adenylate cyclase